MRRFDGIVEQATEDELAEAVARRRPHRAVQLPAHRRRAGGAAEAASRAARSSADQASS